MSQNGRRRVVITGVGAVTPLGNSAEESWTALCQGKSGVGLITKFDASTFKTKIAAEVKNFNAEDHMLSRRVRRTDPFIHYAMAAARMAMDDSGLMVDDSNADRVGVVVGTCAGGMFTYENNYIALKKDGPESVSPFFITGFIPNMAAGHIALAFGARGPGKCVVTACATGSHAIGDGYKLIQFGDADAVIAGGSDAYILPIGIAGLDSIRAVSSRNDEPEKASRPFDKDRDGFVLGEGAGVVILEDMMSALRRGARIYGEVVGYGYNIDGTSVVAPDWENQTRCMKLALKDAGLSPEEVDYVNAHGTSTQLNDVAETKAIKAAFGEHSRKLLVSSNKSMTGHTLAAAGALEAIFTAMGMNEGIVPPTINYVTPDPECDLDYVPNEVRKADVKVAISNSFGFGGVNCTLALKRFEDY